MCDPVTLVGASPIMAGFVPSVGTIGLFGAGGSFGLGAGSLFGAGTFGAGMGIGAAAPSSFGLGSLFQLGSFFVQGFGAIRQGQFYEGQAEQSARIAEFNARVAENDAIMARQAEQLDNDRTDDLRKRIASAAQTSFTKSGVVINIDTPLAIQERIATDAAEDQFNRTFVADQQVAAARVRAAGGRASATNFRITGQQAVTSSRLKAIGAAFKVGESLLA
jgi:uncharacterized coiled-coil protein SlyX